MTERDVLTGIMDMISIEMVSGEVFVLEAKRLK